MNKTETWDTRYISMASTVATWSKDPSTKVGAYIVDEHNRPVSHGYNGFPKGMDDSAERYADRTFKYAHVVHAEMNAIISAGRDLNGCTVYITHPPCTTCLCAMKQAMVARVVCGDGGPEFQSRWCQEGLEARQDLANELGIELIVIPT